MKRILIKIFLFLFLAAASFGIGVFIAEKKIGGTAKKVVENVLREKAEDLSQTSSQTNENVEIAGKNEEENSQQQNENSENEEVKFSFAILGDTQYFKPGSSGNFQRAVGSIKKINPDLVFGLGDLISSCEGGSECEGKYNSWKNSLAPIKAYAMQGNHDRTGKDKADKIWEKVFSYLPGNGPAGFIKFAYSFDYGNSHFVVLDSDKPKENDINETQLNWLENDLAKNKKENNFIFFHEPAYPTNFKIGESLDKNPKSRNALWDILVRNKVTAVFSGHEHIQSRRKISGLYQFVFGNVESFNHLAPKSGMAEYYHIGPAFGLVEVKNKEISVKTLGIGGDLLNSFTLSK